MMGVYYSQESRPLLQQTLAAGTAVSAVIANTQVVGPHHPITCQNELRFEEDNTFSCPHSVAPPGEERTQQCLDATVAFLLIELALQTL